MLCVQGMSFISLLSIRLFACCTRSLFFLLLTDHQRAIKSTLTLRIVCCLFVFEDVFMLLSKCLPIMAWKCCLVYTLMNNFCYLCVNFVTTKHYIITTLSLHFLTAVLWFIISVFFFYSCQYVRLVAAFSFIGVTYVRFSLLQYLWSSCWLFTYY
jgi:hypothetical protein